MIGIIISIIGIVIAIIGIFAVVITWMVHTDSSKQLIFMWSGVLLMWLRRLITIFGL